MIFKLWNYLKGYVIINVSGFSVERFINLAARKGVYIWDIRRKNGETSMKASLKGFKALKECGEKTGCKYKITEKRGLPFKVKKYQKRRTLAAGAVVFVIALYVMSSFVWRVEVDGAARLSAEDIKLSLAQNGLKLGALKKTLDLDKITYSLLTEFPDISWASVKIKGTDAIISISETIPKPKILDKTSVNDIIAKKDGVIVSCATAAGTPLVAAGDVVKEGDALVSGKILLKEGEEIKGEKYVAARAEVFARVWYEKTFSQELSFAKKRYTGETARDRSLIINGVEINVARPNIEGKNYEATKIEETPLRIGDYALPISLKKAYYAEYEETEITVTQDEAKAMLEKKLAEFTDGLPLESAIEKTDAVYSEEDNKITLNATVTVVERIDEIGRTPVENKTLNGSEIRLEQN